MNRTLRRPMFRIGGVAEGITSGLQPRQGYATNKENLVRPNDPSKMGRGVSDFLINWGLDMASRPAAGNIFQQAATSARGPFKEFQAARAAGEERDFKMGLHREKMDFERDRFDYEQERDKADRDLQKHLGELEAKGEKEFIEEQIDAYWDSQVAAAPPSEHAGIEEKRRKDKYNVIVLGADISDRYKILSNQEATAQAYASAEIEIQNTINPSTGIKWVETDANYGTVLQTLINKYLRLATKFLDEEQAQTIGKATGGRVGYVGGGDVAGGIPTAMPHAQVPTDQGEMPQELSGITYEELRARLPQEVGDDIVRLLANSREALEDFASIQTEQDIANFNKKYGVNLVLPSGG